MDAGAFGNRLGLDESGETREKVYDVTWPADLPEDAPSSTQERAYTSPIRYAPPR
jgi:hypothetical protein